MQTTIDSIKVDIISIETVASNLEAGRPNLAAEMKTHKMIATLWVKRPRGSKIGMVNVYESGIIGHINWML